MPYIDGNKLMQELSTMYKSPTSTEDFMTIGYDHAITDVIVTVHKQLTFEAVDVVRCKDCIHGIPSSYDPRTMKASDVLYCDRYRTCHFEDYYCADGKRKETEDAKENS